MDIKVGIQNIAREIVVESSETADAVQKAFSKALKDGEVLTLTDLRGRKVMIPAESIGYLDLGEENARHVGFSV